MPIMQKGRFPFLSILGVMAAMCFVPPAGLAAEDAPDEIHSEGPSEAELEAEFRRNREALRALPEFRGTDAESHLRFAETLHHRGDLTGAVEEYHAPFG